ncbi:NeuD/PglB/VioB family sugar acetyltransferase [Aeromonas hydrophila]
MNKPLLVLGAGGHASVLVEILRRQGRTPMAMIAPHLEAGCTALANIPCWHDEDKILSLSPDEVELVNGIGSLPGHRLRAELFARYQALGYHFARVVSPQAIVSDYVQLTEGVQVMAGAIIQTGARVGPNTIINTGAIVDHDCQIGADNHIAPGAVLSGGVMTGARVHVGTGAAIIQGIIIGNDTVVGAGATVTRSLDAARIAFAARGSVGQVKQ